MSPNINSSSTSIFPQHDISTKPHMEESLNYVSDYNRINSDDGETSSAAHQSPLPQRSRTIPIIITLSLFTIIIGTIIGVTIVRQHNVSKNYSRHLHRRRIKPPTWDQSSSVNTMKAVCAVTQHPESCFTDVSSFNSGDVIDPMMIFNLTLRLAVNEVANVSNELRTGFELRGCVTVFDDAVSQLRRSVELVSGDGEMGVLMEGTVGDLMTWISVAMMDVESCVDGLEEMGMGSMVVDEMKMRVQRLRVYLSYSLAILGNMKVLVDQFGV